MCELVPTLCGVFILCERVCFTSVSVCKFCVLIPCAQKNKKTKHRNVIETPQSHPSLSHLNLPMLVLGSRSKDPQAKTQTKLERPTPRRNHHRLGNPGSGPGRGPNTRGKLGVNLSSSSALSRLQSSCTLKPLRPA